MLSIKHGIIASLTAAGLTACAPNVVSLQPIGAPEPENSEMTFVDADGCRWWVIGNVTNLSWAPMTNSVGEHVCESLNNATVATETVKTMNEALVDPNALPPEPEAAPIVVVPTPAPAPTPVAETEPTPEVRPTFATTTYFVQVASFAQKANAEASEKVFIARGLPVSSGSQTQDDAGLYRLVLGPFSSESSAAAARLAANTEGFADAFSFQR